ncbi:heterodisulfide reductase-related iron-sulfur binding cluster [Thalassotalea sp. PS06]|uniref:heterodisulfide reductase-related iron-sulfur binding cluster n=1 Tax=Thalassotalea sp. PS06 TaxID=2594005 RepID=UPI0011646551|nr:heterodisulfide reductase-related iron-sulfur binding cluster [Thalassotalea sp. PS06]QDP00827.1 Fe-S oxidoreductase [Thalassotalea sp. PS06]
MSENRNREGSLEAPTRHPIDWQSEDYWNKDSLNKELERVYDICHGCRRCVSLCDAFPTLFDLVDESETMEVDGVSTDDYHKVVEQCYLCDMCYMSKCPYVPPHEWNVDFPHLMLRAKAIHFKEQGASKRDSIITNTDMVAKMGTIPVVDVTINKLNKSEGFRKTLEKSFGVHHKAPLPEFSSNTLRKQAGKVIEPQRVEELGRTKGKVALFTSCYGNSYDAQTGLDLIKVFQHNNIQVELTPSEVCCGMPKLELGDLDAVHKAKQSNIAMLHDLVMRGYDLTSTIPSCVLMFKQEIPLMYPDDEQVQAVKEAFFDPFEYLFLRHKQGAFNTEFSKDLGDITYQVACHLRVQNIGLKTRDILSMIPNTQVHVQERCSGHDGTYAVKAESYDKSVKIARPVVRKVDQVKPAYHASDCPMASKQIVHLAESVDTASHPMTLLRMAYGLD